MSSNMKEWIDDLLGLIAFCDISGVLDEWWMCWNGFVCHVW